MCKPFQLSRYNRLWMSLVLVFRLLTMPLATCKVLLTIGLFLIVYDKYTPKINTCQHIFYMEFCTKIDSRFCAFWRMDKMDEFVGMNGIISFIYVNINFTYDYYFTVQMYRFCIVFLLCLCYLWDICTVSFCFRVALTFNTSKL